MASPDPDPAAPARSATPALRASDADRERVAAILRDAGGDGRLTVHELDERLDVAYGAVTLDDLSGLTADLVPTGHRAAPRPAPPATPGRVAVRDGGRGTRWLVAMMGGVERRGTWRLGRNVTALALMGGVDLDLSQVEFDDHDVHLRVLAVMGGAEIRVPDHMNVVVSSIGIMGGNDVRIGSDSPDPGGPVLHLQLVAVMGGSSVRRGPRPSRRERQLERERRRGHLDGHP